jgi:hypothetical protein
MKAVLERSLFFAVLFVALGALYAPALDHGPNLDDREQIQHVEYHGAIRALDTFFQFRPLKNLWFHTLEGWFGEDLQSWRIVGLAVFFLHLIMVELYLERITDSRRKAMVGTTVYGFLAVHSPVVVWLSATHIGISALFLVAALYAADRGIAGRPAVWYPLSVVGLAVALLSYEAAVVFPALLALQAVFLARRYRTRGGYAYLGAVAVVLLVYLSFRLQLGARTTAGVENLAWPAGQDGWLTLNGARYVALHAFYAVNPWQTFGIRVPDLPAEHLWAAVGAWVVLVAALIGSAIALVKRRSLGAFGFLFFFVGIAPLSNLVPVGSGPVADYYLFLPSLGLVMVAIALVDALRGRVPVGLAHGLTWGLVVLWVLANAASTRYQRIPAWENPLTLARHARQVQGDSFYQRFLAARIEAGRGDYRQAVDGYAAALEAAPYHEPSQAGYVVALINARDLDGAAEALDRSSPQQEAPREILRLCRAFVREQRGEIEAAAAVYREIASEDGPAPVKAKITALIRLTEMSRRWGIETGVPYSVEQAPFDVRSFYLFPGYQRP